MKILSLTIDNIASIEHAVIDFGEAPLAGEPLFLISGPTGSGKTTILNAICLALYNNVPCLVGVENDSMIDSEIKTYSPQQLMRKGSVYAEVTLTYLGNDKHRYLATWTVSRARRKISGKIQAVKRTIENLDSGETFNLEKDIKQVVSATVGLSFDQFTRTTMLAQGQFAAFLRAGAKEKSEILEKLTGTKIYSLIGSKIFEMRGNKAREYDILKAQIDAIKPMTADEIATCQALLEESGLALTAKVLRRDIIDKQCSWLKDQQNLEFQIETKNKQIEQATKVIESDFLKADRQLIGEWDATAQIRQWMLARDSSVAKIANIEKALHTSATKRCHEIADGIAFVDGNIAKVKSCIDDIELRIAQLRPKANIYANAQRIDQMARQLQKLIIEVDNDKKALKEIVKELKASEGNEKPLAEILKSLSDKLTDKLNEVKVLEEQYAKYDVEALNKTKTDLDNKLLNISKAVEAIKAWSARSGELTAAAELSDITANKIRECESVLKEAEVKLPEAKDENIRAEAFLKGQMTIADNVESLRQLFEGDNQCPLCGNPHAHIQPIDTLQANLASATLQANDAKKTLDDINRQIDSAKTEIATLKKQLTVIEKDVATKAKAKQEAEGAARNLDEHFDADNRIVALLQKYRMLDEERNSLKANLDEALKINNRLIAVRKEADKLRDSKDKATQNLNNQQQTTIQTRAKSAKAQESISEKQSGADATLSEIGKQLGTNLSYDTYISVVDSLIKEAAEYDTKCRDKDKLTSEAQALCAAVSAYHDSTVSIFARFASDYMPLPRQCSDIETKIRSVTTEIHRQDGELINERKNLSQTEECIRAYFESSVINTDRVIELQAYTNDIIDQKREGVRQADENLSKLKSQLEVLSAQMAEKENAKPDMAEDASIEPLLSEREVLDKEIDEIKAKRAATEQSLKDDADKQRQIADQNLKLQQVKTEKDNWDTLNDMFGTADGSRFKTIFQSYILRVLLSKANQYLMSLAPRYTLVCEDGSLTISVIDSNQNDEKRNVSLLSGGESFVVSLALALGLSAISKDKINVDILFIDEGFGTLDKDLLETVINTLDRLIQIGNRRIGIISHVAELAERITTQIRVIPTSKSSSAIEVIST